MAVYGLTDQASHMPKQAPAQVGKAATDAERTALFGNTTTGVYAACTVIGVYGVSAAEAQVTGTTLAEGVFTFLGSGYTANAAVTVASGAGTMNTTTDSDGRLLFLTVNSVGSAYTSAPSITIAAPTALFFNANSTVTTSNVLVGNATTKGFLRIGAANVAAFANGDLVRYTVAAGNTALGGLATATDYYVAVVNSTSIQLSASNNPFSAINISSVAVGAQAGHSLTGQTATGIVTLAGGVKKGVTAGWNIRTVGGGGRAGRVSYECLVATKNITSDASDDKQLPDS